MRISEFLKLRFWSSGLIVAAVVGGNAVLLHGQTPPSKAAQTAPTTDNVESWLRDAQTAMQQSKWDHADQCLKVANAMLQQSGSPSAEIQGRIQAANEQLATLRSGLNAPTQSGAMSRIDTTGLLLQARQALAKGDVMTARQKIKELRTSGADYSKLPDSPEKVEAMIDMQNKLADMARNGDANEYNRLAAQFLVQQGDAILAYNDGQTATFLADLADKFQVDPSQMSLSTTTLRERIKALASTRTPEQLAVGKLMSQAQLAVDQQQWNEAARMIAEAQAYNLPETAFGKDEMRPWQLELVVNKALKQQGVEGTMRLDGAPLAKQGVVQADFNPERDTTRNETASFLQTDGKVGSGVPAPAATNPAQPEEVDLGNVDEQEKLLFRRLQQEVFKGRADADRMMKQDPRQALDRMVAMRNSISSSELSATSMAPLLTIIDRDINEMQRFIQDNISEIQNDERNATRMEEVELDRERKYEIEQQVQKLTETYNKLMEQGKYEEAGAIADQVVELAPDTEIASLMKTRNELEANTREMNEMRDRQAARNYDALRNAQEAGTPIDDRMPYQHGDAESWHDRSTSRLDRVEGRKYRSEAERRIWNKLKTLQVQGSFTGSLAEAMSQLASQVGENITFDTIALQVDNINSSTTPVNQSISNPISAESALKVILGSQGLTFIVEDEVIKVTSQDAQRKKVVPKTYYVGDVISQHNPANAPSQMNFITPNQNLNSNNTLLAQRIGTGMEPISPMANGGGSIADVMAQQLPGNGMNNLSNPLLLGALNDIGGTGGPQRGVPMYTSMGAPQLGGITIRDFQNLIGLITQTIEPDSWSTSQGEGTIVPYVPNLSLIVSQTQEVHDEIQDMLTQLRKLNDVQIVVEVRFVTLGDTFFERIGVDFDFKINDNTGLTAAGVNNTDSFNPNVIVGRDTVFERFSPTADLDVGFNQNSIGSSAPVFGGFDAGAAGNFGFAILSDIEAYFLIVASKGDSRTNITNAPTVTMFNGQSANVSDFTQRPFVTSLTPVVGDFAVAQQPIITLIPDGTTLNVTAVASDDRRFVTLSLVPYFSHITDVKEFTFDGRRTTRQTSSSFLQNLLDQIDPTNTTDNDDPDIETTTEGTTIQQPVVAITTVSTVVSVPDGGTVLMGGIKRLSETRVERGIPFLSNIPYVNRLFKNVGVGRETTNLMMMVTPRIIIQEEEEQRQVGPLGN